MKSLEHFCCLNHVYCKRWSTYLTRTLTKSTNNFVFVCVCFCFGLFCFVSFFVLFLFLSQVEFFLSWLRKQVFNWCIIFVMTRMISNIFFSRKIVIDWLKIWSTKFVKLSWIFMMRMLQQNLQLLMLKVTISDSLRLRKIFNPFRNREEYLSNHNMYHFSSNNRINLTEKTFFNRFHSVGPEHCFFP